MISEDHPACYWTLRIDDGWSPLRVGRRHSAKWMQWRTSRSGCVPNGPFGYYCQLLQPCRLCISQTANRLITLFGTVSPAGGNLKEPVTESTKAARCFFARSWTGPCPPQTLSLLTHPQLFKIYHILNSRKILSCILHWTAKVNDMKTILQRGKEVQEQINILGDDGVPWIIITSGNQRWLLCAIYRMHLTKSTRLSARTSGIYAESNGYL